MAASSSRLVLRDLPVATRLVLAVFLLAVAAGYFSALVQLHVVHASPGQLLPGQAEVQRAYGISPTTSQMEQVLSAGEDRPFNGTGSMAPAFTGHSLGWDAMVHAGKDREEMPRREAERQALLDFVRNGCDRKAYDEDSYAPSGNFPGGLQVPERFLVKGPGMSHLERVILAPDTLPFNGEGSMHRAFFDKSSGWAGVLRKRKDKDVLLQEREGEVQALASWIRSTNREKTYSDNNYPLPPELADKPITPELLVTGDDDRPVTPRAVQIKGLLKRRCERCHDPNVAGNAAEAPLDKFELVDAYCTPTPGTGQPVTPERVKIRSLITDRCVRCHAEDRGTDDRARNAPLDSYERFTAYCAPGSSGGMSLRALAQTTHAHLLSFAMLFFLTGLVFSLTSYPGWIRGFFGPLTLVAQMGEIACWWLSRVDPRFTWGIVIGGGLVGAGLLVHVAGGLLDMMVGRRSRTAG